MSATVIRISAGIGKTTVTAEEIANYFGIVDVYVATHKLASEWESLILKFNPRKRVQIIHGRGHKDDDSPTYCKKLDLVDELVSAGCSVFPNLCHQSRGQNQPPIQCEHYSSCSYILQFGRAEVYIYTHAHLGRERSMLEQHRPNLVVIDESFWNSCIQTLRFNVAKLRHPDLPAGTVKLCEQLADAFNQGLTAVADTIRTADKDGSLLRALTALRKAGAIASPDMSAKQIRKRIKNALPLQQIRTMLRQLRIECQFDRPIQSVEFERGSGEITVHHRMPITRFQGRGLRRALPLNTPFLVLDASADEEIIGRFFDIDEFIPISVERNAVVTQCHSTSCPNGRLVPGKSADEDGREDALSILDDIQRIIDRYAQQYKNVLVVGPSSVTGNPSKGKAALLRAPPNVKFEHFNALRGVDAYKDFDAIIVIGRNQPAFDAMEDYAKALYFDHPEALLLGADPAYEERGYSLSDGAFGVSVQVHPDQRIQGVMEQHRERESEQVIDRLRPVHHQGTPKVVFLLSNIPLDIEVAILRTWNEMANGGSRLEQALERCTDGVLSLRPEHLAATYPDLWPTEAAAKKDSARKKGQLPIDISNRKMSLFKYKPASQRNWSWCLSRFGDPEIVAKTLTIALGEPITAKPAQEVNQTQKAA